MPSVINDETINTTGTHLQGVVYTTYEKLVEAFGEPTYDSSEFGDGKVTTEWTLLFDGETVATIYDWKQYELGTPFGEYDWHIGGLSYDSVHLVSEYLAKVGK